MDSGNDLGIQAFGQADDDSILPGTHAEVNDMGFIIIADQFLCDLDSAYLFLHQCVVFCHYKGENRGGRIQLAFNLAKAVLDQVQSGELAYTGGSACAGVSEKIRSYVFHDLDSSLYRMITDDGGWHYIVCCREKIIPGQPFGRWEIDLTFTVKTFTMRWYHNFIEDQVPALRSRVKENRVKVPGDPVTVSGERFCRIPLCQGMRRCGKAVSRKPGNLLDLVCWRFL